MVTTASGLWLQATNKFGKAHLTWPPGQCHTIRVAKETMSNLTMSQLESLLKEASMEYVKTGANYEEVAYYALELRKLAEAQR